MAILEAIRITGYKKEEIMKQYNIGKTAFYTGFSIYQIADLVRFPKRNQFSELDCSWAQLDPFLSSVRQISSLS